MKITIGRDKVVLTLPAPLLCAAIADAYTSAIRPRKRQVAMARIEAAALGLSWPDPDQVPSLEDHDEDLAAYGDAVFDALATRYGRPATLELRAAGYQAVTAALQSVYPPTEQEVEEAADFSSGGAVSTSQASASPGPTVAMLSGGGR